MTKHESLRSLLKVVTFTMLLPSCSSWSHPLADSSSSRRTFFQKLAGSTASLCLLPEYSPAADSQSLSSSFAAYKILPDASERLNPTLKSINRKGLVKELSKTTGALWLGEHHNAYRDHVFQLQLIQDLHESNYDRRTKQQKRPLAIGLEQVQIKFQTVLDDFVTEKLTVEEMKSQVEWEKRWTWPFEGYESIFVAAQQLKIPLIALNVDSEDLQLVENGGIQNLPRPILDKYILDRKGFAQFTQRSSYGCYADYVITPSYKMHQAMGLLEYSNTGQKLDQPMSFKNFFSGRILWDESMATQAFKWSEANPQGLMVGLVGADHVKFQNGIPARYDRVMTNKGSPQNKNTWQQPRSTSILLNPSLVDSSATGTVSMEENSYQPSDMILQIGYTKDGVDARSEDRFLRENFGGVLPLADYILTTVTNAQQKSGI